MKTRKLLVPGSPWLKTSWVNCSETTNFNTKSCTQVAESLTSLLPRISANFRYDTICYHDLSAVSGPKNRARQEKLMSKNIVICWTRNAFLIFSLNQVNRQTKVETSHLSCAASYWQRWWLRLPVVLLDSLFWSCYSISKCIENNVLYQSFTI